MRLQLRPRRAYRSATRSWRCWSATAATGAAPFASVARALWPPAPPLRCCPLPVTARRAVSLCSPVHVRHHQHHQSSLAARARCKVQRGRRGARRAARADGRGAARRRYKAATAGVAAEGAGPAAGAGGGGGEEVEISRAARSLTRSLARAGTPSPLVQLLAKHRQRRCGPAARREAARRWPRAQPRTPAARPGWPGLASSGARLSTSCCVARGRLRVRVAILHCIAAGRGGHSDRLQGRMAPAWRVSAARARALSAPRARPRREDLTCWRASPGAGGAASPTGAAPPTMDVTAVIRRLRAEPLSPRVHPLYLQEGGALGRMARAASAPASSTPRARGSPAPDQAHCSAPLAELGGMLVSGRSLDAGPGCAPGGHSFPALSAPGEAGAAEGAAPPGDGAVDAGAPGDAAADAGVLRPVLPSGACAGDSDALAAPVRAHASAAAAALMASCVGNPFAAAADAGGADDAFGAADERGGVAVSDPLAVAAGGGCGAAGEGSGAHEAGAAQLGAAVDVALACGAALRNGHCSAACSGCLNCVGIKARSGLSMWLLCLAPCCPGSAVCGRARGQRAPGAWVLVGHRFVACHAS